MKKLKIALSAIVSLIGLSCSQPIVSSKPVDVYISDVNVEPLTGKVVRLPKEDLDLETAEGKAKAKKLIVDLTVSDRRNARGYNSIKKYHEKLKAIYNSKKKVTPIS